jgi:putative PEP-CTERM system histidine kinase
MHMRQGSHIGRIVARPGQGARGNFMLLTDVGLFGHLLAALGFLALAVVALWQPQRSDASWWLAAAALLTALWAAVFVATQRDPDLWGNTLSPAETLRSAGWIAFLVAMLRPGWRLDERLRSSFILAGAIGFLAALQLALDLLGAADLVLTGDRSPASQLFIVTRLAVSVSGLVLVHNLYVSSDTGVRSGMRLLAVGLGGLFVYDLNFYTLAFLLPPPSEDLFNIRGAANTIVLPLLIFAAREAWVSRVQVSRQVVFHTLSFAMIGSYLIVMALLAYGLRLAGGDLGRVLQVTFLFATVISGAIIVVSPRFRAALRVKIAQNFFAYRYDYRVEWLRFIATVSGDTGPTSANPAARLDAGGDGAIHERIIQAICAVLDSPGGVLLIPDEEALQPVAEWRWQGTRIEPVPHGNGLSALLEGGQRILNFDELRAGDASAATLPDWARGNSRAWLAVPLVHLDALAGVLIMQRSLASRVLNWEDYDLLRTLGRQAASYIAESAAQLSLDEAAKFDEFNRRFAFIMHDIKNLVSQLSLVARNAERHADKPDFRKDMVATLQSSVGKMNDLLARLSQRPMRGELHWACLDLGALLAEVIAVKQHGHAPLTLAGEGVNSDQGLFIAGDIGQIEQLFLHLIQNAIDASEAGATIAVTVVADASEVSVRIEDHGCGMSARFIRQELFQPFRSTKPDGFGIGAYEAREIARSHGGRLDVVSRENEGSIFTVTLPRSLAGDVSADRIAAQ